MQVQGCFSLQGQMWPTYHVTNIPTTDTCLTHPLFKIPQDFPTNWETNDWWSPGASIGAWSEGTVCSLMGKRVQWTEFLLFRHAGQNIVLAGAEGGQMWGSHDTNTSNICMTCMHRSVYIYAHLTLQKKFKGSKIRLMMMKNFFNIKDISNIIRLLLCDREQAWL